MRLTRTLTTAATVGLGLVTLAPVAAHAQMMPGPPGQLVINTPLTAMPSGNLTVRSGARITRLRLNVVGLTPGSGHEMVIVNNRCATPMPLAQMRNTMAVANIDVNNGGSSTTDARVSSSAMRSHQSALILLGPEDSSAGKTVIACASLRAHGSSMLQSVTKTATPLSGNATLAYDATAQTLTVQVHATGFHPDSLHAAHVHQGTCQSQGPVLYMLPDLRADAQGAIDATETVSGVTSAPPASGWYLNIHMGNSQNILDNGVPTQQFQPRLCGNIGPATTIMPRGSQVSSGSAASTTP
jgi:hypothetical protein